MESDHNLTSRIEITSILGITLGLLKFFDLLMLLNIE